MMALIHQQWPHAIRGNDTLRACIWQMATTRVAYINPFKLDQYVYPRYIIWVEYLIEIIGISDIARW